MTCIFTPVQQALTTQQNSVVQEAACVCLHQLEKGLSDAADAATTAYAAAVAADAAEATAAATSAATAATAALATAAAAAAAAVTAAAVAVAAAAAIADPAQETARDPKTIITTATPLLNITSDTSGPAQPPTTTTVTRANTLKPSGHIPQPPAPVSLQSESPAGIPVSASPVSISVIRNDSPARLGNSALVVAACTKDVIEELRSMLKCSQAETAIQLQLVSQALAAATTGLREVQGMCMELRGSVLQLQVSVDQLQSQGGGVARMMVGGAGFFEPLSCILGRCRKMS